MQTNSSSDGGIASSTQLSWNLPSNLNSWSVICLRSILAAFPRMMTSELLKACDKAKPTSFWTFKRRSLPLLWASSSGISASSLSLSLVEWISESDDPIPNCSSLCLYKLTRSASLNTTGPSVLSFVSTIYAKSSENTRGYISFSRDWSLLSFAIVAIWALSLLYRAVKQDLWYFSSCATMSPSVSLANSLPSFRLRAH